MWRTAAGVALAAFALVGATKPSPRITGMWDYVDRVGPGSQGVERPPVTPEVAAQLAKRRIAADAGYVREVANILCLPTGFPKLMQWKSPIEILESPGRVTVISEHDPGNDEPRTIYLGKPVPADLAPSWNGYSAGAWKGEVLEVTTTGFNDRAPLFRGVPRTADTKIVERFRLTDDGATLLDEMTITDPHVLTAPWVVTLRYKRMPADTERLEAVCEPDLEALNALDLASLKDLDPEAARLLDPALKYNPGGR